MAAARRRRRRSAGIGAVDRPRGAAAVAVQRRIDGSVDAVEQSLDRRPSLDMVLDGEGTPSAASAPLPSVAAAPALAPAAAARKNSKQSSMPSRQSAHVAAGDGATGAGTTAGGGAKGGSILAGGAGAFFAAAARGRAPRPRAPRLGAAEHAARGPLRLDGGGEAGDVAAAAEAGRAGPR